MAKNYLKRYQWLIDTVRVHGPITFKGISDKWEDCPLNDRRGEPLSNRTFFNHLEAIGEMFNIEIKCDRARGYYIVNDNDLEGNGIKQWLLESLSMNNLLNESRNMRDRILFEKIPSSQKWLTTIVNAMRDGRAIETTYKSFWRDEESTFVAYPYCLKLFKQRWYMLAATTGKKNLRIFALDERMISIEETDEHYKIPAKFNAEEYFSTYFGVIVESDWKPENVKIRVMNGQDSYFDTLPLHHSQTKVLEESGDSYSTYHYYLVPTHDFKKELMSWGPDVEVLAPDWLREDVKEAVVRTARLYGD